MSLANQLSREDMLRELELLPVWQLRQPLPAQLKTSASSADAEQPVLPQLEVSQPALAAPEPVAPVLVEAEPAAPELTEPDLTDLELTAPDLTDLEPAFAQMPQAPVIEAAVPETMQVAVQQVQALPLRLLLSEANVYAFLIEPYAAGVDAEPVETLLRNMMRAMQLDSRVDVTDSADQVLAVHVPKVIISLGAEPANRLFGTTQDVDGWRSAQQPTPPIYEGVPLLVTHHPAHLLEHSADKADAWRDLCFAMKLIQRL